MMLSFFTGISFTPSFLGETSSLDSTLRKKLCERDGSGGRVFFGCPGCYLGSVRVYPYNRDVAIFSFLLNMLLASPVVRYFASGLVVIISDRDV